VCKAGSSCTKTCPSQDRKTISNGLVIQSTPKSSCYSVCAQTLCSLRC
jgi:hypothetical protein